MKVKKRNGEIVDYNYNKIVNAVKKAFESINIKETSDFYSSFLKRVEDNFKNKNTVSVEEIQDVIESTLEEWGCIKTLKAFIRYRTKRTDMRNINEIVHNIYEKQDKLILNENGNIDGQTNTAQRDFLASEVAKRWSLETYLPQDVAQAHKECYIHYHDLGFAPLGSYINCCLVNAKDMLENGFTMGSANVTQPKSLRVACNILAQIITAVSSQNYGGTTINRIDEVLEPYAKMSYDYYLEKGKKLKLVGDDLKNYAKDELMFEMKNSFKQLEYNINCSHNSHSQVPFVTLGFGLAESEFGQAIQQTILKTRIKGLGKEGKTAIFPKLLFTLKKGLNLNKGDKLYWLKELAMECSAKRMYPDYLMYDKLVELTGGFKASMGCRSFLSTWENDKGEEVYDGRCNLGVVSLNLPRIALELKSEYIENRITEYFEKLDEKIEIAHKALKTRIKRLKNVKAKVAPICWVYGALGRLNPEDNIIEYVKNGYASISLGYVGLNETVNGILCNTTSFLDETYKNEIALKILKRLHDKCNEWKEQEGFGYSVYATPSENLCHRFEDYDKKHFGIIEGVTDKEYYTNSFHLDVQVKTDPFTKIDFESQYLPYTTGGMINYVELPNMQNNIQGLETILDYAYDHVAYFGINSPIDTCKCGWSGEAEFKTDRFVCKNCGTSDPTKLHCIRRICGYCGEVNARPVNKGKIDEFTKRVKHL